MGDNQQNGFQRQSGGRGGRGSGGRGAAHGRMRMDEMGSNKRKRGEQHEDPYLGLLSSILRLGDRLPGENHPVEKEIKELANSTGRAIASMPDQVIQTILDCAVEVGAKVHMYAALVGLWHADEENIVSELLEQGCLKLNAALGTGDKYQIRLLLRFFATLSTTNVVSMQAVFGMLDSIVQGAIECIQGGYQAEAGQRLQPYSDSLVYSAAIALPWMAPELQQLESDPEGLTSVENSIEQYLSLRQQNSQQALNAFPVVSLEESAPASLTGNGVAEFLPELWEAIKQLKANQWQLISIPSYSHSQDFEAHLAAGQPMKLHELTVPCQPPGVAPGLPLPQAAAAVLHAYPSRGGLNLQLAVQKQPVTEAMSAIDRIVIQEYVIDTMHYFDGDNNELARRLGIALPVPDVDGRVLAAVVQETIFSQLLRLPHSELGVLAYAKVTTNLCKLKTDFAQPIGGCVRALKDNMGRTDPEVALRVAEWLALHINNHDFIWGWQRWENVLELPPYDPVRHFVAFALERTMRVSFRDFHLQYEPSLRRERIPEQLFQLLPPVPSPKPVFESAPAQQAAASATEGATAGAVEAAEADADAAQPNGTTEAADGTADAAPMEAVQQQQQQEPKTEAIPQLALDLLQQVKQIQAPKNTDFRHQPQGHTALHERLSAWLSENSVEEGLGGPLELLRWLSRCLLTIGGRSIGHLYSYLDRHDPIMSGLVETTGAEGEDLLMQEATTIWGTSVQHTSIIVDHLMGKRWLSGPAVLRWLFSPAALGMQSADDAMECLKCMDILHNTVARILARSQDDREELQQAESELQRRQTALAALQPAAPQDADGAPADPPPANPPLEAAQQAVQTLQSHVAGAQLNVEESNTIQNDVLLQVCKGYLSLLTRQAPASSAQAPAAAAAAEGTEDVLMQEADAPADSVASFEAWQLRTLAAFRAFLRNHYMVMVPLASQVQELLDVGVSDNVKQVVSQNLCL